MSKPSTAIASDMSTAGMVEKSFKEMQAEQGRIKHELDCRMFYVGDSIGQGLNFKYLETSIKCQIESVRAYSSVMDENARWPSKNFTDVVTQYLRGRRPFNVVVMSAPTVDITNLNTKRLTQRQCEERAIESSKNMIRLAEKTLANNRSLEKVILMNHPARFDCTIKKKLAILANSTLIKFWACSPLKDKIHVGQHSLDSLYDRNAHVKACERLERE